MQHLQMQRCVPFGLYALHHVTTVSCQKKNHWYLWPLSHGSNLCYVDWSYISLSLSLSLIQNYFACALMPMIACHVGKTAHFHHSRHVAMPTLHTLQKECNLKPMKPQETGNGCRWHVFQCNCFLPKSELLQCRHFTTDLMEFYRENQQPMQLYDVNHASRSKDLELKSFNMDADDWDVTIYSLCLLGIPALHWKLLKIIE